jgi:hypothetical protein
VSALMASSLRSRLSTFSSISLKRSSSSRLTAWLRSVGDYASLSRIRL